MNYETMKNHAVQQDIDSVVKSFSAGKAPANPKFLHCGYPLGVIIPASEATGDINTYLSELKSFIPYSNQCIWAADNECIVCYMARTLTRLQEISCGKCVLCREGLWQLRLIMESVTRGSATMERLGFAREIAEAMLTGCDCDFGKGAGALFLSSLEHFESEFAAHIKRKQCPALVCPAFYTIHILPDKCIGCGDCIDECDEDAIEGKKGFIHIIDNDICERCGKCINVCDEDAVIKAGPIKPRVPNRLVKVGTFKSRRHSDDDE